MVLHGMICEALGSDSLELVETDSSRVVFDSSVDERLPILIDA